MLYIGEGDWVTEGIVSQGVGVRKLYRLAKGLSVLNSHIFSLAIF
jgi:hypothetical protein